MKNLTQSEVVIGHGIGIALPSKWQRIGFNKHLQNK